MLLIPFLLHLLPLASWRLWKVPMSRKDGQLAHGSKLFNDWVVVRVIGICERRMFSSLCLAVNAVQASAGGITALQTWGISRMTSFAFSLWGMGAIAEIRWGSVLSQSWGGLSISNYEKVCLYLEVCLQLMTGFPSSAICRQWSQRFISLFWQSGEVFLISMPILWNVRWKVNHTLGHCKQS